MTARQGNLRTANCRTGNMRTNMRTRLLIGRDIKRALRAVWKYRTGFAVRIVSLAGLMNLIAALLIAVAFVYLWPFFGNCLCRLPKIWLCELVSFRRRHSSLLTGSNCDQWIASVGLQSAQRFLLEGLGLSDQCSRHQSKSCCPFDL